MKESRILMAICGASLLICAAGVIVNWDSIRSAVSGSTREADDVSDVIGNLGNVPSHRDVMYPAYPDSRGPAKVFVDTLDPVPATRSGVDAATSPVANPGPTEQTSTVVAGSSSSAADLIIVQVPRPNSDTYSTEQARALLPGRLAAGAACNSDSEPFVSWKNPTHGFKVFFHADGSTEVLDPRSAIAASQSASVLAEETISAERYLEPRPKGWLQFTRALDAHRKILMGNPMSVLIASGTPGWDDGVKPQIIEKLFKPYVQLYIVTAGNTEPPAAR